MNLSSLGILAIILFVVTVVAVAILISVVNRSQKQRALLDELFEQAPQAVALMSADYVVVRVNREFTRLFGYERKDVIGRDIRELTIPDESQGEVRRFADMLARGLRVEAEGIRRRKDGSRLCVSIVHVPVSLPGGLVARYAIYRDVTERKQAEESLKLFRTLIDQSSDAIDVIDPNTLRFIDCNEIAHRSLGYSREEFLSLSVWDVDPAIDQESFARSNEEIEKSGSATFETLHRRKDGSTFPVEVSVTLIRLEREYRLAVVRDITERKRAEEALRLSEERFAKAFHSNPEPISIIRYSDSAILEINDRWESVFGYTRKEVVGRTAAGLNLYVNPNDRLKLRGLFEEQGFLREQETEYLSKSGDACHISMCAEPIVINDEACVIFLMRDITERKRAEQALRQAEEKYRSIFEHAVEGIFQTSPDGQFITANPALARMLGYDSPDELLGSRTDIEQQHYVAPARRADFKRLLEQHGVVREFEHQAYRKDGSKVWLSENVRVVRDEGGAVLYYEGFTEDITERKRAEDALKESEERHRIIAETASDAFVTIDEGSTILFVNSAAEQIFGYTSEEMLGRPLTMLMPEYLRHLHTVGMRRHVETGKRHISWKAVEMPGLHKSGREIPLELSFGEFTRDGKHVVTGIARDITDRKRAEEQLKQSERELAEAQHLALIGSWNWDLQSNALNWSDGLHRVFGVDPRAFNPAYEGFVTEFVHEEDQALVRGVVEASLKSPEPFSFYYRIRRPDGEARVIHARGEVVCDEHGKPVRMFGTAQDVTERKQAEERLTATNEQLRALSARIHSAKEEEGARIAREIHDELGAALSSLKWDLQRFDEVVSELGDQSRLHELRKRIKAMLGLTETTFGTVRRIASELRPSILDDLGLVDAIEWQAEQFQGRTGITCRYDCSLGNLDLSREEATAVFRILQEALTNVMRHARATSVDITMKAEAGGLVLKIIDNGRGILENEKSGARSLGLLGMQERAHLIGGKINVIGVKGKGTEITVRIPTSG